MLNQVAGAAAGIFVILAAVLVVMAIRAYVRVRAQRMLMLTFAFVAFLAQGIILAVFTLSDAIGTSAAITAALVANAIALIAVYAGISKP